MKNLCFVLALMLLLSMSACQKTPEQEPAEPGKTPEQDETAEDCSKEQQENKEGTEE